MFSAAGGNVTPGWKWAVTRLDPAEFSGGLPLAADVFLWLRACVDGFAHSDRRGVSGRHIFNKIDYWVILSYSCWLRWEHRIHCGMFDSHFTSHAQERHDGKETDG